MRSLSDAALHAVAPFVSCPCHTQRHNDGRGAAVIVVASLSLHHCCCVTWVRAWARRTVARCAMDKSIARAQGRITAFSQSACHLESPSRVERDGDHGDHDRGGLKGQALDI